MSQTANNLAHKYSTTTQSVVDLEEVLKQKKAEVEEIQRRIHAVKEYNSSQFFKFFVETCPTPYYELKPEYEEFNRMAF
jgi:DNA repair exonuclease SbcCD ATPase subunit